MADNETDNTFGKWWAEDGRFYDPDTEDVSWFDKRKDLAELAYAKGVEIGMARSRNYTANSVVRPDRIHFANGRVVRIVRNTEPGVHHGVYLDVLDGQRR